MKEDTLILVALAGLLLYIIATILFWRKQE